MGYDLVRFVGEIDSELLCQICKLVLENPIETSCEHFFCNECIKTWISVKEICPVDRQPLTTANLRQPNRLLRCLLGRLDIKCDFHGDGCVMIVKLDNLKNHRSTCNHHPDAEVICDMGCNLKILRREQTKNCHAHFEKELSSQEQKISQLLQKVHDQSIEKAVAENVIAGLKEEIARLNINVAKQEDEEQISKVRFIGMFKPKYRIYKNIEIVMGDKGFLQIHDKSHDGFAQFDYQLKASNAGFSINIVKNASGLIVMGLTRKGCTTKPPGYHRNSFGYASDGTVSLNGKNGNTDETWKDGDIITCRVIYERPRPIFKAYCSDKNYFQVCFFRNDKKVNTFWLQSTIDLFPTVYIQVPRKKLQNIF